ncbi:MAG TPA: hypothetical protein DCR55_12660 [Lentisphaeria bacterium]|nr:hypothetical protein [Lentisphaeria bacterium]
MVNVPPNLCHTEVAGNLVPGSRQDRL